MAESRTVTQARDALTVAERKLTKANDEGDPGAVRRAQTEVAEARLALYRLGINPDKKAGFMSRLRGR